jgi:hypothetical protein
MISLILTSALLSLYLLAIATLVYLYRVLKNHYKTQKDTSDSTLDGTAEQISCKLLAIFFTFQGTFGSLCLLFV